MVRKKTPSKARRVDDQLIAGGRRWKRVETPRPWKPKEPSDSLTGTFMGAQVRRGREGGEYMVYLIKQEQESLDQLKYVSGTVVNTLFLASGLQPEDKRLVRIVFRGMRESADGERSYKDFDLYVAEELVKRS